MQTVKYRSASRARKTARILSTTSLSAFLMIATHAFAQEGAAPPADSSAPASPAADASPEEAIIVTGSRVAQTGFSAPTPTQIIGGDLIARQSAATIGQVLYQNPAIKASRSPGSTQSNGIQPGQQTADLRALGGQRTLVLVNGSRVVPQAPSNNLGVPVATDLNLIPTMMVDRIEIVTGGASAQYGSDAIAGVVNILLKRRYDGIQLTAQTGISQEGDNFNWRVGGITGQSFGDDRGHIVASVEYNKSNGMGDIYTRDWGREQWQIVSNSGFATNGQPALILARNVNNGLGSGGVITGPANFSLRGQTFNADGSLRRFDSGTFSNTTFQIGGEGESAATGISLIPSVERFTAYGRAEYEFSDAATVHIEGGYAESTSILNGSPPRYNSVTIQRDNAYLPTAVRTALQGLNSFTLSKISLDSGGLRTTVTNKTPHVSVGIEGDLGGSWHYDAYASFGENRYRYESANNIVTARANFAIDAVVNPANGQIVCRATLPGASFNAAAAGCVPMNLFGPTSVTEAARNYVAGTSLNSSRYRQTAAAANLRGNPFSTWAGEVATAVGVEFRRESQRVEADPIGAANGFTSGGNAAPFSAAFDVKEIYGEAIVPLARDLSFARSLDVNGAVRYADYSTAGGQVTWKVGAVYEPISGVRFRATKSRDIRAPALFELYSPGSEVTANVTVRGQSPRIPQNVNVGNPNLKPEIGDTWTAGVVLEPGGALRGLRISTDYYDINLKGAITNLSAANIGTLCSLGQQQFCDYFTFVNGVATRLIAPTLNLGALHNVGIDAAVAYRTGLSAVGIPGDLSAAFSGTYIRHAYVNTGVPGSQTIDRAGENGSANLGALPRFRSTLSLTYDLPSWSFTAQWMHVSGGKNDVTYNTAPSLTINDNSIESVEYFNLYTTFKVADRFEFFMSVNNLLNQDPPVSPYSTLNSAVNGQYYDKVGRAFQFGVNVRY